jgi:hypothetical protein
MKILYAARMARYDLLRATCFLATRITKWDASCDKMLHRLVCYINSSLDKRMTGWVGDDPSALELVLFTDADFAGDGDTHRSTSGVFLCLKGPRTFVPLSAVSKRQSCVSHSTPEAEIVAADHGLRTEALPATSLWEVILGRSVKVRFLEDNSAAIRVIETGRNPSMRHMGRTHRVDLAFLHECLNIGHFSIEYCDTKRMAADVFTKAFRNSQKWEHATSLVGLSRPGQFGPADCPPEGAALAACPSGGVADDAAPATESEEKLPKRRIVEFCCGEDSLIGKENPSSEGCEVVRLTVAVDVTTPKGLATALAAVSKPNTLLWASMPCTGGSPWQRLNKSRPGVQAKLEEHWRVARLIWASFEKVARRTVLHGGEVAIEWPNGCEYWKWPEVVGLMREIGMESVRVDGCSLGLTSRVIGLPILKPWRIASTSPTFLLGFGDFRCPGEGTHPEHTPCQGVDTS